MTQYITDIITDIFPNIVTDKLTKTELEFLEQIAGFVENNSEITNYRAQVFTAKSAESVKKHLAKFVEVGIFVAEGENKGGVV
jgi:predicted HTH transcriptional regulator